jgi:phenylalanyl-tRNA synthetase beta chain
LRVSLEWLKEYVNISVPPSELAELLSMSGTAVDRVIEEGKGLTSVVVGHVVEVKPHPDADNLRIAIVDDGSAMRKIVCGAPNLKEGEKYALALPGAHLPAVSDRPLHSATIRGVKSEGMLASGAELGVNDDASGIFELGKNARVGIDIRKVVSLEDVIFDVEITPNRPDCMSMVGIAREVAALTDESLRSPRVEVSEKGPPIEEIAKISINDPVECPRYTARVIRGVKVAPSPLWMQRRLLAAGARPINNIVDVTNYVLLELGQPLHAFDLDLLGENTVVVRLAHHGELITTLDGVDRQLDGRSLVIADIDRPVALAGIMGGEDSEVTERTANVLIESAYFEPTSILRTSKRLGIRTEASSRFERGTDPEGTPLAAERASQLMAELAGGVVAAGEIDVYPSPISPVSIELRPERANRVLGTQIPKDEIAELLTKLEMDVEANDLLNVGVPSFRRDLEREIDLIEEIARIYGYWKIPEALPAGGGMAAGLSSRQRLEERVVDGLAAEGLMEVWTDSFMRIEDLDRLRVPLGDRLRELVTLMNPLAETGEAMRTTIVPGLLRVAARNLNRGNRDLALYEKGRVFFAAEPGGLPTEIEYIDIMLSGKRGMFGWSGGERDFDFYDLKGVVENLGDTLKVKDLSFEVGRCCYLMPGRCAEVIGGENSLGYMGQLHPLVADVFGVAGEFYIAELALDPLLDNSGIGYEYRPVGRFPSVKVDIAVVVEDALGGSSVEDAIRRAGGEFLRSVRLFDVYYGPQIPQGKKSLAYSLEFASGEMTLTDEVAHVELERIIDELGEEFGAQIRGRELDQGEAT